MRIVYSPRAIADLRAISAYLKPLSPQGARHVGAAILHALQQLLVFPHAGTPQKIKGVRKIITRKYPYLIYYTVDEPAEEILVIAIQHSARARAFTDQ